MGSESLLKVIGVARENGKIYALVQDMKSGVYEFYHVDDGRLGELIWKLDDYPRYSVSMAKQVWELSVNISDGDAKHVLQSLLFDEKIADLDMVLKSCKAEMLDYMDQLIRNDPERIEWRYARLWNVSDPIPV